jgi:hypothetical protein
MGPAKKPAPSKRAAPSKSAASSSARKSKKKKLVDVKDLIPQLKKHDPGKLRQLKAEAIKNIKQHPFDGNGYIRVIETNWAQSGVLTAGYLGVHSTDDLKRYAMEGGKSSSFY